MAVTQTPAPITPTEPDLPGKEAGQSWREKLNSIGSRGKRASDDTGTLVTGGYASINLVSPSIIEAQEARRLIRRFVWIAIGIAFVVAAGWMLINFMNSDAGDQLNAANNTKAQQMVTLHKLNSITSVNASLTTSDATISKQLATEAYTSRVITEFLHSLPRGVVLNNYTVQMLAESDLRAPAGTGTVSANDPCGDNPNPFQSQRMIGCIRFQGTAPTYDVALRLNTSIHGTYLAQTYVGGITSGQGGWTFNGTVAITPEALSGRYSDGADLKKGLLNGNIGQATDAPSAAPTAGQ